MAPSFLRRHKGKLLGAAAVVGLGYWALKYAKNKILDLQERLLLEQMAKDNLERRFEQNQNDATFTIMALLSTMSVPILEEYDVEDIRRQLQALRGQEDADQRKQELWEEMKVKSLVRAFTLLYASALLVVFTRVQLNILGRRSYVSSIKQMALPGDSSYAETSGTEDETNRDYLTFSWWLLHQGWKTLGMRVEAAVTKVAQVVDARSEVDYDGLSDLVGKIQRYIDYPEGVEKSFLAEVLPTVEEEPMVLGQHSGGPVEVNSVLRTLLDETADLMESPNVIEVVRRLVHAGITTLMARMSQVYQEPGKPVKLAQILGLISRQAHQIAAGSPMTNEYVDAMVEVPELDALCAVIYSNY